MESVRIAELGVDEVDRVESLWKGMVEHHREVVAGAWPVHSPEQAWRRRRAEYVEWLSRREGVMLAAFAAGDPAAPPDGYAMLVLRSSGATWDMGERVGEIESLAVAEPARGAGVGTALIGACRERLAAEGVAYWGVSVVEANEGAARLYEREGFRPYYRHLWGQV